MSRIRLVLPAVSLLAYACAAGAQDVSADPPGRVARLAYLAGDVQFAPGGETDWSTPDRNRPLVTGDRLLTTSGGRAALELGDATVRINDNSAFDLLNLDDTTAQIQLSQGALNLRVRQFDDSQTYEVDTPAVAFVASQPGDYRMDVAPDGQDAIVTVFEGAGIVYGENGVNRAVSAGHSYRFADSQLVDVTVDGLPPPDGFDRFSSARDGRYTRSVSRRYVSANVIGYDDLDDNGDWRDTSAYGAVWYPTRVASNWAPYRDGHWAWIDPYGWTWIDNAQWGFAPYHYGRWVYVSDRWGWIPGEREERAVYAPALVAFVGGSGLSIALGIGNSQPVGWFPLGPRDVYLPPYQVSRNYFNNVNVTNIRMVNNTTVNNTTVINKTVINNYYNGYNTPAAAQRINYAYRATPQAVTVVPRNVFAGARPVTAAMLHVKPAALAKLSIASTPHVSPSSASLRVAAGARPAGLAAKAFERPVIARHAPPPPPVAFAAREKRIASQGGMPLASPQLRQLQQVHANRESAPSRVRLATPGASAAVGAGVVTGAAVRAAPHAQPNASAHPAPTGAPATPHPGELTSARFAHPGSTAAMPATPAIGAVAKTEPHGATHNAAVNSTAANPGTRASPVRFLGPPEKKPGSAVGNANAPELPSAPQQPVEPHRTAGFVHAPSPAERTVPTLDRGAQQRATQQQAAHERVVPERAPPTPANAMQNRVTEDRAMQAPIADQQRAAAAARASQAHAQHAATQDRQPQQERAMPANPSWPVVHAPPPSRVPAQQQATPKPQQPKQKPKPENTDQQPPVR